MSACEDGGVKPRVTTAAVLAAHAVLDNRTPPKNYYSVSAEEQRRMRLDIVRQALIASYATERGAS